MAAAKALDVVPDRRKQDLCRRAYQELHYSTHCASIASASVSFTTRTGSCSSSPSFAALRRRAPATTSYFLSSSSRTRRGARIPCAFMLAASSSRFLSSNRLRGLVADSTNMRMGTLRYSLLVALFCASCMTILLFIVLFLGIGWGVAVTRRA